MPPKGEVNERHTYLNAALAAIESTERDCEAAKALSEERCSKYCTYLAAVEDLEDVRSELHNVSEATTAKYLKKDFACHGECD